MEKGDTRGGMRGVGWSIFADTWVEHASPARRVISERRNE